MPAAPLPLLFTLVMIAFALTTLFFWRKLRLLTAEIHQRDRALEESKKQDALATLAGGIAHDFNNILGSILGFGTLLEEDLLTQPELRELAMHINASARRGQKIVSQLTSYTRKSVTSDKNIRLPVPLDALIRENIAFIRPTIRSSTRITFESKAPNCSIVAEPTQISQALVNLCVNADHAIGVRTGEIRLCLEEKDIATPLGGKAPVLTGGTAALDEVRIINGALLPGRYASISVTDTGEGMTRDVAERIFEPFFTTKDVDVGTGLGLPAIQGIVHSHGGAITVRTLRHKGTTFTLLFPL